MLLILVGETGPQQGTGQAILFADTDAAVIEKRTAAPARGKQLLAHGVIHHGLIEAALVLHCNGNRELRESVQEIGGPVQRVNDPLVIIFTFVLAFGVLAVATVDSSLSQLRSLASDMRVTVGGCAIGKV